MNYSVFYLYVLRMRSSPGRTQNHSNRTISSQKASRSNSNLKHLFGDLYWVSGDNSVKERRMAHILRVSSSFSSCLHKILAVLKLQILDWSASQVVRIKKVVWLLIYPKKSQLTLSIFAKNKLIPTLFWNFSRQIEWTITGSKNPEIVWLLIYSNPS